MREAKAQAMKIAIVDDEQDMRQSISQWLALSGFETEAYSSAEEALKALGQDFPGVVISDIKMPEMDGMTFLKKLMNIDSSLPVIVITGHGDVQMAVEAMRVGAYDFLEKPFDPDRMTELAKDAIASRRIALDSRALRRELSDGATLMKKLIGASPAMERLREHILDLGQADGHVLIDGETGTGKTLAAHALHAAGAKAGRKFVHLSCAGKEEEPLARQLFGPREDGARQPALTEARGGTLAIEDIDSLHPTSQARLLAWANEQGSPPDTRIVAISNVRDGKNCEEALRPELYFRLAAMRITLPPLRQRGEDILMLFTHYAEQFAEEYGCVAPKVSAKEAAQLLQAPWPGNVRQLINIAESAVMQSRRGVGAGAIASLLSDGPEDGEAFVAVESKPLREHVEAFERMLIDNTLRRHKGAVAGVMEELCLPRRTLNEKMTKYGLNRTDYA